MQISLSATVDLEKANGEFYRFVLSYPLSLCFQVTQRCNYCCPYCISSSSNDNTLESDLRTIKLILKKMRDAGVQRVDLTGGEPFIRKDIMPILQYAVRLGLGVVVTSNGSLISPAQVQELKKLNLLVQISLDAPSSFNDSLRTKGSFRHALRAIKRLRQAGVEVRLNCVIQKKNRHLLEAMADFCKDTRVNHLYFILVSAQGRAKKIQDKICLTRKQEREVHAVTSKLKKDSGLMIKMHDYKKYAR
ncbi:MAG: radical SAM protein, partial [uncultured bacterium]